MQESSSAREGEVVVRGARRKRQEDGKGDQVAKAYPLERLGEVEDVAGAALFLGAETSRWITGQTWVLDGGGSIAFRPTS